ncbi:MAG: tetratricopeptide repeat protein [Microcoleaceae cyanobacterium]
MSDLINQETLAFSLCETAEIYLSQGKLDAAYKTCLKALEILPNCGEIYKTLGNVMQGMGKLELAINSYLKAIEENPNLAEAYANIGSINARQQEWEEAIKYYQKAIEIKPDTAGFYRNLAKIWQRLGKDQLVTECSYQAVILEPTSATATQYLSLGNKLLELGKLEEAIACYHQGIKLDKKLSVAYNKLGNTLIQTGEIDAAIKVYSQGIKINSNNPRLYYNLGEALTKKQEYQQATTAYNRAIELNPNRHLFYGKLGDVLQKQNFLDEALACFIQALQIKPNYEYSYSKIADILEKKTYTEAARNCRIHKSLPKDILNKFCQLTEDRKVTSNSINTIHRINIHPPSQINLLASQNIERKLHPSLKMNQVKSGEAFIATVPEARAWGDGLNTAVITADNKLIIDISSGAAELIISSEKLSPVYQIDGTVAFLSVRWGGGGYYHWMFDVLARISLLYKSNIDISSIDKFIFNKIQTKFQRETIKTLGISQDKIIESIHYPHIHAQKLIVPSIPYQEGFRNTKWACNFFKEKFLPNNFLKSSLAEKIYISRKQASKRRVVNEAEVVSLLEKFGFQIIILELMSVAEQALCFANAKVVVAPHGAGLTNLVFSSSGTKVIEFFDSEYVVKCYWLISNVCGLEHYHLIGDEFNDDFSGKPARKNIFVNLQKLLDLIKLAKII